MPPVVVSGSGIVMSWLKLPAKIPGAQKHPVPRRQVAIVTDNLKDFLSRIHEKMLETVSIQNKERSKPLRAERNAAMKTL